MNNLMGRAELEKMGFIFLIFDNKVTIMTPTREFIKIPLGVSKTRREQVEEAIKKYFGIKDLQETKNANIT